MSAHKAFVAFMRKQAQEPSGSGIETIIGKPGGAGGEPGAGPLITTGPQTNLKMNINRSNATGAESSPGSGGMGPESDPSGCETSAVL